MKKAYRAQLHLSKANISRLGLINKIIEEYRKAGYKLTLRQLYYQLVSRDVVPNVPAEYDKLSNLLVAGRMAGVVDWDAIEDRIRVPFLPYWVHDVNDAIDDTIKHYRLDRMKRQPVYIEVWVEKDALSGVLRRITQHYHVNLMVNRGYSSCTAMHDAALRFQRQTSIGKDCYVLYLGDHDPSGVDMVRDIKDRLEEFGAEVKVDRIALTMRQIQTYNPPPNPAKIKDPRAKDYIAKFGNTSWEVDALRPDVLNQLLVDAIEEKIDKELWESVVEQEKEDKTKLEGWKI